MPTIGMLALGRLDPEPFFKGIREGLRGTPSGRGAPRATARMVRDPVCGTFVLPDRALSLAIGREQHFFCSAACRDKYRARTA